VAIDANSRILRWNRQAETTFGWLAKEVIGRPITDTIIPPQHREAHRRGIEHFRETGAGPLLNRRTEITACRKDGTEFPVEISIWPVAYADTWRFNAFIRDVSDRKLAEDLQRDTTEQLGRSVAQLEAHDREVRVLTEMGNVIMTCVNESEAHQVVAQYCGELFPDHDGAVYVINPSRNVMEAVSVWGTSSSGVEADRIFRPDACWALRRGTVHIITGPERGLLCSHVSQVGEGGCVCVPMLTNGEALGVLHLNASRRPTEAQAVTTPGDNVAGQALAVRAAEHLALGLGNLRLRESLRVQSIRDPLTNLYNRRYLEETLERELMRARRSKHPLGIIASTSTASKRSTIGGAMKLATRSCTASEASSRSTFAARTSRVGMGARSSRSSSWTHRPSAPPFALRACGRPWRPCGRPFPPGTSRSPCRLVWRSFRSTERRSRTSCEPLMWLSTPPKRAVVTAW